MPLLSKKKEYDTSEENYLKAIYHLTIVSNADVSTNSIAEMMETKASSVTDMLKNWPKRS
jgi:Mn-dependent DtxR family transcriptional regulator